MWGHKEGLEDLGMIIRERFNKESASINISRSRSRKSESEIRPNEHTMRSPLKI